MFKLEKKYIAALAFLVAAVVLASLLPPQVLRMIMDDYLSAGEGEGLLLMGLLYLAAFGLVSLFDFLKGWLLTKVGQSMVRKIRSGMQEKLTRLPAAYFTKNSSGRLNSLFINDVDNISALFTSGAVSLAIDCCKIVGIVVSIWIFSKIMGIFTLCLVPVIGLLTYVFRTRMLRSQQANLRELGKVNSHIGESIRNILMIKTYRREQYMQERYEQYLAENYKTMNQVNFYDSCYSPVIQILTALSISIILYLSIGGEGSVLGISVGEIAASVNLITNLFAPIDSLGMELTAIQKGLSGIYSVREFMNEEEDEPKDAGMTFTEDPGTIEFDHVDFSYDGEHFVLKDFCLKIKQGENVVLTGRTGAGKSTVFKLVTGMLKPQAGRVLIGGIDACKLAPSEKKWIFGYVAQQFSFVSGTLAEQISLSDPEVSREDILKALAFVGLDEVFNNLPSGIDTQASELQLSQGQKQLLSIARATCRSPRILLLDEVTANLDTSTEKKVVEVLKKAGDGRTILSIAHRPSTISSAERNIQL